jgi:D-alanyl-D-alanine carboxypeptidase
MPALRHFRRHCLRTPLRQAWVLLAGVVLAVTLGLGPAAAQIGSYRYASIVIDARSGTVISAINADEPRYPASLVKVMTIYMAFEALRDRRISLHQPVPVSAHAASMSPTKLGLVPGTRLTVEEAILGLITKSANDAAAALAELLGGTEDRFAQMMTLRARALGMASTRFENASGLPDLYQVSTARDMALLARRLVYDFPNQYHYFATTAFVWHGRTMYNHHQLLTSYAGADGLKTGYTQASGYNLITSASRGGVRLIGVVMGGASGGERDAHMAQLLDAGFDRLNIAPERRSPPTPVVHRGGLIAAAHATPVEPPPPPPGTRKRTAASWGIQVGSFAQERLARGAAEAARRVADGGEVRVETAMVKRKPTWRAQVAGLSQADARAACQTLARRKTPCVLLSPDQTEIAAR